MRLSCQQGADFLDAHSLTFLIDKHTKEEKYDENAIKLIHEMRDNLQYAYNLVSRLEPNNQTLHVPANAKKYPISEIIVVSDLTSLDRITIPTLYTLVCIDG